MERLRRRRRDRRLRSTLATRPRRREAAREIRVQSQRTAAPLKLPCRDCQLLETVHEIQVLQSRALRRTQSSLPFDQETLVPAAHREVTPTAVRARTFFLGLIQEALLQPLMATEAVSELKTRLREATHHQ